MHTRLNVVLLCHFGRAGYNIQRSLRAIGARTFLVHDRRAASVRWSRGCKLLHVTDDLETADADVITQKINFLHRKVGIHSVIPADVHASVLLSKMRAGLEPPIFPVADSKTLRTLDDKWKFAVLCMEHGIDIPKTMYFEKNSTVDVPWITDYLSYPIIVKPSVGFGQRNIVILKDATEAARFRAGNTHQNGMVIQQFIEGDDWALSVFARAGVVTHWAAWVCPTQLSSDLGVARFMTTKFRNHDALVAMGKKIIAKTGFSGVANFDARLDRNGRMVMFECNPRFFNRMLATRMCGLNFVAAGLPVSFSQRTSLAEGDYYPWQRLFSQGGLKLLFSGKWKLEHLVRDVTEMLSDPFPPIVRKLTKEDDKNL